MSDAENVVLEQALHEQRAFAAYTGPGSMVHEKAIAPYLARRDRAAALLEYINGLEMKVAALATKEA